MNIRLPYWNGKKWIFRKPKSNKVIHRTYRKRPKILTVEQIGEKDDKTICSWWHSQPNPQKVYVGGNRIIMD